jgi:hypothetical protein
LNIFSLGVVGIDYTQLNDCGGAMGLGASCTINVKFSPHMSGTNTTRIEIKDDAPGSPHSISLTGIGTEFLLGPAANALTTQTVNAGQTASFSLALQPMVNTRDSVTLSCTGTVPLGTCGINPSLVTFTSPNAVGIAVTISTTARSSTVAPPPGSVFPHLQTGPLGALATLLILTVVLSSMAAGRKQPRRKLSLIPTFSMVLLAISVISCGGGGGGVAPPPPPPPAPGTPTGTYNFTITAKSASSTNPDQTVNLVLNVK